MKRIDSMKAFVMAAVAISAMTLASCDDDDEPASTLKLSSAKIELAPNATATVTATNGTAPLTVSSSDTKIATVAANEKTITITGVAEGKAAVKVTDKNNLVGSVTVTVKKAAQTALKVDKEAAEVAVGKTADITVSGGTSPYTATSADTKTATASVKDGKVTITGVKAGKTTVTIADKNKNTAKVSVTVK